MADPGGPATDRGVGPGAPTKGEEQQILLSAEAIPAATGRRLRQPVPRTNRTCPRFSDPEWSLLQHAAQQAGLAPGGYTAAAAVAAATSADPNAAVADYRRGIQELMESNRQLGGIGNNLNQVAHFLNAGGQPAAELRQLLARVEASIDAVDQAVDWLVRR
ncbi:MobC family plasmid mobilization relaxosome protein [Streptomyces sp. BE20]|uniref:MobC family plasmid mobilization relaxosome protein n=1 Tax=Streptomyces sp. BE20 TaxID=3002525 RepID=UPI002E76A339|nr:MobC family plasmid mobilization relaxosome protein [Streptomyces sp. BE20]MEE1825342.1 MobC family plasmid mobilization relaxosome protein [Streptomyces sp. BE20]